MPGKINVYNLGVHGVDIVSSPLHSQDGSFTSAQNAASSPEDTEESLRKRPGMTQFSTGAIGSGIVAIHNIPAGSV